MAGQSATNCGQVGILRPAKRARYGRENLKLLAQLDMIPRQTSVWLQWALEIVL